MYTGNLTYTVTYFLEKVFFEMTPLYNYRWSFVSRAGANWSSNSEIAVATLQTEVD